MFKFLVKWVLNGVIGVLLLQYFTPISFWTAFLASTLLTVIAYVIGDQWILRKSGNTVATISDGILALVYLYFSELMFDWGLSLGEMLFISAVLAIGEMFLHRYVFQDDVAVMDNP